MLAKQVSALKLSRPSLRLVDGNTQVDRDIMIKSDKTYTVGMEGALWTEQRTERHDSVPVRGVVPPTGAVRGKRIWIDIDNSPHVPLFVPIIEELEKQGIELILTARHMYQTCELLKLFHLHCRVIGSHYGRNKLVKVLCNCLRATQLVPTVLSRRPDLALSHGSRAQVLICKMLRIPVVRMDDYEYSTNTGFVEPDWVLMPDVIPTELMSRKTERVLKYPGLKEDVYVPRFKPDPSILRRLGISSEHLVVTLRPPAHDSHYHTLETERLFTATLKFLADISQVLVIALPRNPRQSRRLHSDCADLIAAGRMVIPDAVVDGLNLMWFSDLVIGGGGTMTREAAVLGVPAYSIFRGTIGAVDQYLAKEGRLVLIRDSRDLREKVVLAGWKRPPKPDTASRPVLQTIVNNILAIVDTKHPVPSSAMARSHSNAPGQRTLSRVQQGAQIVGTRAVPQGK